MNLNELFKPQEELDHKIEEEHNLNNQDLKKRKILSGIVELAETANEGRWFKFWSKDQKARINVPITRECIDCMHMSDCIHCDNTGLVIAGYKNPLLEEYVDTIHFTISVALEYGYTEHTYKEPRHKDLTDRTLDIVYLFSTLSHVQEKVRHNHISHIFNNLIALGYQFGFDEQMVLDAYYKKNEINLQRQQEGY